MATFFKSIICRIKNMIKPNVFKLVIKIIFINSSPFILLIINLKIFFNFQKEWHAFDKKRRTFKKNKDNPLLNFKCFEHAKKI